MRGRDCAGYVTCITHTFTQTSHRHVTYTSNILNNVDKNISVRCSAACNLSHIVCNWVTIVYKIILGGYEEKDKYVYAQLSSKKFNY